MPGSLEGITMGNSASAATHFLLEAVLAAGDEGWRGTQSETKTIACSN